MTMTRRQALARGAMGISIVAAGGLAWRAWDNGVFTAGQGPPYEPWSDWRSAPLDGPLAVVRAGILAASAHNTQPWRFHLAGDRIALHADHARNLGSFDPYRRELTLSLGCALENMALAAAAQGFTARIEPTPGRLTLDAPADAAPLAATLSLEPGIRESSPLFEAIGNRHTNRGGYRLSRPLQPGQLKALEELVGDDPRVRLFLFDAGPLRTRLRRLIISTTESIIADPAMAADSARWFRFSRDDLDRHRDGITLDATGMSGLVNGLAKIIPEPSRRMADRQWFESTRDVHVATAPLLGMVAVRDLYDRPDALAAGRLWQRIHLWATASGIAAQPLNQPAEMVDRARQRGLPSPVAAALAGLTGDPAWLPTFVFRMGYAKAPARLSPRRALDDVIVR
jgi:hypothetical protein